MFIKFASVIKLNPLFLFPPSGPAGSGPSSPHRSAERGASTSSLHGQQRGRENSGCSQIQTQRGPEGHPGWHVRPKVFQSWAQGLPAGHPGAWGARWGLVRGGRLPTREVVCVLSHCACECASAVLRRRMRSQMMRRSTRWLPGVKRSLSCLWWVIMSIPLISHLFSFSSIYVVLLTPAHGPGSAPRGSSQPPT